MSIALLLVLLIFFSYLFTKYKSQGQCGIYLGCSRLKNNKLSEKNKHPRKVQRAFTYLSRQNPQKKPKSIVKENPEEKAKGTGSPQLGCDSTKLRFHFKRLVHKTDRSKLESYWLIGSVNNAE